MAKKSKNLKYYEAIGKRKEATALVRLYILNNEKTITINGTAIKAGEIMVNKKPITLIYPSQQEKNRYLMPLILTQNENRFALSVLVKGGGRTGQLEAIIHGIARALVKVDSDAYRSLLKKQNLLTRDARAKERRKVGTGGKARRKKQSPKR